MDSETSRDDTERIEDLELDVSPHDSSWFQSKLLNCINALHEADHEQQLRIQGRVHVLQDLFSMSDETLIELAARRDVEDEMRGVLGDE